MVSLTTQVIVGPHLHCAGQARRQSSVTGRGINNFLGRTKTFFLWIRKWRPKNKNLHCEICASFHEFWGEDRKKKRKEGFIAKCARISTNSMIKVKKNVFIAKSEKKQFLLTNSGVLSSNLVVSDLELLSGGTVSATFFGGQFSLEGAQFEFGGAQAVIWGCTARNAPSDTWPWPRGPWHLWYFCNIFLPNIGEDQQKWHHLSAGPLAVAVLMWHVMVNPALAIALRSKKVRWEPEIASFTTKTLFCDIECCAVLTNVEYFCLFRHKSLFLITCTFYYVYFHSCE